LGGLLNGLAGPGGLLEGLVGSVASAVDPSNKRPDAAHPFQVNYVKWWYENEMLNTHSIRLLAPTIKEDHARKQYFTAICVE
jgi:hypothetical protein